MRAKRAKRKSPKPAATAPSAVAETTLEPEAKPEPETFAQAQQAQERVERERQDPRAVMLALATEIAAAALRIGNAGQHYMAATQMRGFNQDPNVFSAALAARDFSHKIVRSFYRLPPVDDAGELGKQLEEIAETLERLADEPPMAGTIYRLTVLGCALSRIQTACLQILGATPIGGG